MGRFVSRSFDVVAVQPREAARERLFSRARAIAIRINAQTINDAKAAETSPLSKEPLFNDLLPGATLDALEPHTLRHFICADKIGIIGLDPGFVRSAQVELVFRFGTQQGRACVRWKRTNLLRSSSGTSSTIRGIGRCGLDSKHCYAGILAPGNAWR